MRRWTAAAMLGIVVVITSCGPDRRAIDEPTVHQLTADLHDRVANDPRTISVGRIDDGHLNDSCNCPMSEFTSRRTGTTDEAEAAMRSTVRELGFTHLRSESTDPADEQASPDGRSLRVVEARRGELTLDLVLDEVDGQVTTTVTVYDR
jgi:hypothetical protein